jgi:protein SHQ1
LSVHINPYFLRLTFPGRVQEDDESAAQYDPGSGYLTVSLTKETPGEDFKDLDILAKLLAPKRVEQTHPSIEVVGSSEDATDQDVEDELVASAEKLSLADRELLEGEGYYPWRDTMH